MYPFTIVKPRELSLSPKWKLFMGYGITLYMGLPVDKEFESLLSRTNPHMVALLTGGGDYLSEFSHKGRRYLGKPLPPSPTLTQLEACETHLLSLLRKLAPEYPFSRNLPVLIAGSRPRN